MVRIDINPVYIYCGYATIFHTRLVKHTTDLGLDNINTLCTTATTAAYMVCLV